eukprot:CAMPEP_0115762924 /NCGR_PEP_ID=MMETSP0272-20121206/101276_1 /TAXON_ID=71861 /ORGANISM="Scrippsiella trochoidea, Strain CCMP3099" /LENGTH=53 /DNA_ID=CAMNT_0003208657 /DNA_START=397 /DNA_END=558 /DNA_ORIENTATION=+
MVTSKPLAAAATLSWSSAPAKPPWELSHVTRFLSFSSAFTKALGVPIAEVLVL